MNQATTKFGDERLQKCPKSKLKTKLDSLMRLLGGKRSI
jgi:hypothetical protein